MDIQTLLSALISFISDAILPFLMALAFLFFMWNVVRFFIIGGAEEDSRAKAKSLAIWGILAFVVITSLWGIVNLFRDTLGVGNDPITPDYMEGRFLDDATEEGFDDPCANALDPAACREDAGNTA